jgi:hypothetical protein
VGDRGPKGALALGPLGIGVNPLVIAGEISEGVDHLLGDLAPLPRTDRLADQAAQALDSLDFHLGHGGAPYSAPRRLVSVRG